MICVLLSTYNGEKYLEQQIDSVLNQEGVDVQILVRDDGSTDNTLEILDKYQNRGLLRWYSGNNLGFANSFMDLVKKAPEADYYAFCDQDDIWLPNKLKVAVEKLSELNDIPKLYCSALYIYRGGKVQGVTRKQLPDINVYRSLVTNYAVGCTVVFNKILHKLVLQYFPVNIYYHDWWLFQSALLFGSVYFDLNPYILYRQHNGNKLGARSTFKDKLKKRMEEFYDKKRHGINDLNAQELIRCYSEILSLDNLEIISNFAGYRDSYIKRFSLIFSSKYIKERISNNIWLKLRILIGW